MKVTASLTGFDFDIIEGINGRDVPKKALSGVSRPSARLNNMERLIIGSRFGRRTLALEAK